jgi:hypothetical protein
MVNQGINYLWRGAVPAARERFADAYQYGESVPLRTVSAGAAHGLLVISALRRDAGGVTLWARTALRGYADNKAEASAVALDVARFYMDCGRYTYALRAYCAALDTNLGSTRQRRIIAGNACAAAGYLGNRAAFTRFLPEVEAALVEGGASVADSAVEAARGAHALGLREKATSLAARAAELADRRRETKCLFEAETLLEQIRSGTLGERPTDIREDQAEALTLAIVAHLA